MTPDAVWARLHWLFTPDDGGLYDILVTDLSPDGVVAGFDALRAHANIDPAATLWHTALDREVFLADHPDAARLVASGSQDPFHVLAGGVRVGGTAVPDLGVFIFPNELALD